MSNSTLKTISRSLLTGALIASVAACSSVSSAPKPENRDYQQNHPIKVTSEQISVAIVLPFEGTTLKAGDGARFKSFLRDYVARGRTQVTVESTQPARAREVLLAHGLRDGEIVIVPDTTIKAPNAVLSFTANTVVSPECGNWSGRPSFNPSNGPHSNFGCAVQRNTSKMVANPGDFIQSQPAAGGNASRSDAGIFTHQSGAVKTRLLDGEGAAITGQ